MKLRIKSYKLRILILSLLIISSSLLISQDTWIRTYQPFYNPDGENDYYVEDVLVCDDGGYAVNGYYWFFDGFWEEQYGYLMKTDSDGNFLWAKKDTVSWINETESSAFVQTDDGGYLSAVFSLWGGTALIKRDSEGNREWISNCGEFYIHSMDKTNDGDIILAGRMNGLPAMRLIHQNAEIIWTHEYSIYGDNSATLRSVCSLSDNGFAATGNIHFEETDSDVLVIKTDENGDSLWTWTFDGYGLYDKGNCIISDNLGNFICVGYISDLSPIYDWGLAIKIDITGDTLWTRQFERNEEITVIRSALQTSDSNYALISSRMIKIDEEQNIIWNTFSDYGITFGFALGDRCFQLLENEQFVCVGRKTLSSQEHITLSKTDTIGNITNVLNNEINSLNKTLKCYPNPFNHKAIISFYLNDTVKTMINIYNIRGQLVETIINETKTKGNHSLIWNTDEYCSGLYFVQLLINNKLSDVRKTLIIK